MTGKVMIMDHPLIAHKISYIRQESVGTKEFREMIGEIAQLMCYEATRDLKLRDVKIKTPIAEMTGKTLAGKKLAICPIPRGGGGMGADWGGGEGGPPDATNPAMCAISTIRYAPTLSAISRRRAKSMTRG